MKNKEEIVSGFSRYDFLCKSGMECKKQQFHWQRAKGGR